MKTITITDLIQVKPGDKAYFKDCDFGFTVTEVDESDTFMPFAVTTPFSDEYHWVQSSRFDHAERTVEEPEWPNPNDLRLRVYLGADGRKYIYNPRITYDPEPWVGEGSVTYRGRQEMTSKFPKALPLTELGLIPKECES